MTSRIKSSCLFVLLGACALVGMAETPEASPVRRPAALLPESPATLVREVVYNELQDHTHHGYWRYWIERQSANETRVDEQIETASGPLTRTALSNGQPLGRQASDDEEHRIEHFLSSPTEQARHRKEYAEDEHRIGRILVLLPEAFLYEPPQREMLQGREGAVDCWHLRFHPNPDYPAHSIEARIFHAMAGDLWISTQYKRLVRLDGKLEANVDFGYGILGRLYQGGWFRLERTPVSRDGSAYDWKTERLEVHMQGRAMLFKTIARETSEIRGGFTAVPAGLSLEQAARLTQEQMALPQQRTVARMRNTSQARR